jgi:hypothetical protein
MKQYSFKHIFILCAAVVISNSISAQLIAHSDSKEDKLAVNYTEAVMNPKVQNALNKDFKEATSVTWFNMGKNTVVRFTEGKILHRILYTPNGKQVYHISYAEAIDLPQAIVSKVNHSDRSFIIQRGIKVEQGNSKVWIVYAQKDNRLFAVRIEEEETQVFDISNGDYLFPSSFPQYGQTLQTVIKISTALHCYQTEHLSLTKKETHETFHSNYNGYELTVLQLCL